MPAPNYVTPKKKKRKKKKKKEQEQEQEGPTPEKEDPLGNLNTGWYTMAGGSNQNVMGHGVPFESKSTLYMREQQSAMFSTIMLCANILWMMGSKLFPDETTHMLEIDGVYRFGSTGFTCAVLGYNVAATPHIDKDNLKGVSWELHQECAASTCCSVG